MSFYLKILALSFYQRVLFQQKASVIARAKDSILRLHLELEFLLILGILSTR
jgi:hypothetical protein